MGAGAWPVVAGVAVAVALLAAVGMCFFSMRRHSREAAQAKQGKGVGGRRTAGGSVNPLSVARAGRFTVNRVLEAWEGS